MDKAILLQVLLKKIYHSHGQLIPQLVLRRYVHTVRYWMQLLKQLNAMRLPGNVRRS